MLRVTEVVAHGPLEGVRVLDLATERGELAGRIPADFGADRVEAWT